MTLLVISGFESNLDLQVRQKKTDILMQVRNRENEGKVIKILLESRNQEVSGMVKGTTAQASKSEKGSEV
jgi:hypothetical protein